MKIGARVSHRLPGRLRLRIASKRGDEAYFLAMAEDLAFQDGIEQVETNAETGSLLIEHDSERFGMEAWLDERFELSGPALPSERPEADRHGVIEICHGYIAGPHRVQSLVALLLIAHVLWKLSRGGRPAGPDWFNALWVAYNLLPAGRN